MVWGMKGAKSPPLLVLLTFYKQRVLVTLQCAHVVFILKHVVAISESSSKLGILSRVPPLSLFDMLIKTRRDSGT
jgi:hypothetical protein